MAWEAASGNYSETQKQRIQILAQDLNGKVVIVTSVAGGQGAADARLLVERGAKVVLTDFNAELGEATAASLGENAIFVKHDVSNKEHWAKVIETAIATFGQINALVNNAGIL